MYGIILMNIFVIRFG